MSRQRVFKIWLPVLVLVLLPLFRAVVVDAAPPAAPMLGLTPTPTPTPPTPCPDGCCDPPCTTCEPSIRKQVSTTEAKVGEEVTFTITVRNDGAKATVNAHVVDIVPGYFEILEGGVTVSPSEKVRALPIDGVPENPHIDGQKVTVYLKPLSHGDQVTIVIRTVLRAPEHEADCVENIAHFYTDNCGDPRSQTSPSQLPECGGKKTSNVWWMLAAGLVISGLALRVALSKRWR